MCDKWFISIQTETEVEDLAHVSNTYVGVDLGIVQFATLSNGVAYIPINSFKEKQAKLAFLKRSLSKKKKYSQNWKKQVFKISCLHQQIANIRQDYLHKVTHQLSKNHVIVFVEDLQIKNMSRSAKGTIENPGKWVKAKSGLNRSILDQGWYDFRRKLEYKQSWRGGMVIAVPPKNTSLTCPKIECGHIDKLNRVMQAKFKCIKCGYENHADIVGSVNILRAGLVQLAFGEMVLLDHSMKQEPTEVIHVNIA